MVIGITISHATIDSLLQEGQMFSSMRFEVKVYAYLGRENKSRRCKPFNADNGEMLKSSFSGCDTAGLVSYG